MMAQSPQFLNLVNLQRTPLYGGSSPISRQLLSSTTTFYVATNGNDASDGTTPATAWLTRSHAMSVLAGQYDFGGQTVTLQAVAGHANFTDNFPVFGWVGAGTFIYDGANGTHNTTNNHCITTSGVLPGIFRVQNASLQTTSFGSAISHGAVGTCTIGSGMTFAGAPSNSPILGISGPGAHMNDTASPIIVSGGGQFFIVAQRLAFGEFGAIFTLSGQAFGFWSYCTLEGALLFAGGLSGGTGSKIYNGTNSTGPSALGDTGGQCGTGGRGVSALPGNGGQNGITVL